MEPTRLEDLADACELQGRQVAFIVAVWAKKDENYPTLARAVDRNIRETLKKPEPSSPGQIERNSSASWNGCAQSYRS